MRGFIKDYQKINPMKKKKTLPVIKALNQKKSNITFV